MVIWGGALTKSVSGFGRATIAGCLAALAAVASCTSPPVLVGPDGSSAAAVVFNRTQSRVPLSDEISVAACDEAYLTDEELGEVLQAQRLQSFLAASPTPAGGSDDPWVALASHLPGSATEGILITRFGTSILPHGADLPPCE